MNKWNNKECLIISFLKLNLLMMILEKYKLNYIIIVRLE